jgi:pyruvate formate lyase activating enzyme
MNIGGFQKTSLLDYPGNVAAIVWTIGCNFRCPFCYNPQLVRGDVEPIPTQEILDFLETRKGKLDAISITGGEPLVHEDIESFLTSIKDKGFLVKVDTNGSYPERLQRLLTQNLVDYVSMDIKASKDKYNLVTGVNVDIDAIDTSIQLIKDHAPDYEFKTTVIPTFHTKEDIVHIAEWIKGSKRYFLQQFKSNTPLLSSDLARVSPYTMEELEELRGRVKGFFKHCTVRGV